MPLRREYHHGDLARALVDASVTLVRAEGLDRFSLRAASRATSVDPAAVYRHFHDRTALLEAVAQVAFAQLADAMAEAMASQDEDAARFGAAGRAYVRYAVAEPELFRLMFSPFGAGGPDRPALDHDAGQAGSSPYALLVELVGALLGSQAMGDSVERAAVTAWSGVHGLAHLAVNGVLDTSSDLDQAVADVVSGLEHGLARRHPYSLPAAEG
jgi:AcrR family transcriptional regulator